MTITIAGYYGFANAGDEAILASILQQFRSRMDAIRFRVICGDVIATAQNHAVEAVAWNDLLAIQRAIESSDLVVIGGGGLFHDYWGADPDALLTEKHWGIAYYTSCALIAYFHRKPVMLYAVGVGPLLSGHGQRLTRVICEIATAITVRDDQSKLLLEEIGVSAAKVRVTADPAFSFQPPLDAEVLPTGGQFQGRPLLGVSVRHWAFGVHPEFLEREIAAALDLFLEATSASVLFIPFQTGSGESENDLAASRRVIGSMHAAGSATVAPGPHGSDSCYRDIQRCDVVLGMRLHSLIFAVTSRVPAVALSYDPKVDTLARSSAITDRTFDVKSVDAVEISRALRDALQVGAIRDNGAAEARERNKLDPAIALSLIGSNAVRSTLSGESIDLLGRAIASLQRLAVEGRSWIPALENRAKDLQSRVTLLEANVKAGKSELRASESRFRAARSESAAHNVKAAESKEAFAKVLAGIDQFQETMDSRLAVYRSQRAWRVMLAMRKAYTLLVRGGPLKFARFLAGSAVGGLGSLQEYELSFPDIRSYVSDAERLGTPSVTPNGLVAERAKRPHTPPRQSDRYDAVVLGIIDFDFRFQRPQQIAAEMARRGHRIFWVSPSRFLPPSSKEPYRITALRTNIWEVHMRSPEIDVYNGELGEQALHSMTESLVGLYRECGIADNVAYVQLPFWRGLALSLRDSFGSKVLYDCMDDWDTFQNMGRFNVSEERNLVRECDLLIVSGSELVNKFSAQGLSSLLVRNGADYDFFSKARPNHLLADVSKPVVGYFGAIADWIDLDLVEKVAALRPDYAFVLIGQVFNRDMKTLESMQNVRLLGSKPYADIPSYLYHFDVCTIPFLLNQVTKATDPVKLYEYLSLGKPVVATAMAELAQCGDLIYIAGDAPDFAQKLDLALAETDETLKVARIDFAKKHNWSSRVDSINAALTDLYPLVSILVVTFNSEEFVSPCLDSILRNTSYPNYELLVVDNASTDGTLKLVEEYADVDPRIRLIGLPSNTGFAAANNRAVQEARGEYLLFLNIDTMVTSGWLHRLLRHLQRNPEIGLICPVTNFAGNEVKVNFNYDTVDGMEDFAADVAQTNADLELDVAVVPLFCALTSRKVWSEVGELDCSFGMGMFEDDDFSLRMRRAGFRVVSAEDCFVHHFGQGSFAKLPGEVYNNLFERNRKRFEEKWGVRWQPHRPRVGALPIAEEKRFRPATFLRT